MPSERWGGPPWWHDRDGGWDHRSWEAGPSTWWRRRLAGCAIVAAVAIAFFGLLWFLVIGAVVALLSIATVVVATVILALDSVVPLIVTLSLLAVAGAATWIATTW